MIDADLEEIYLEAIREGKGPITSAKMVGASVAAINAYIDANIDFADKVEEARAERLERVANAQWERAQKGDWSVAKELLQAADPDTWLPVKGTDLTLRLGREEDIDIGKLHSQLVARETKELPGAGQEA